MYKIDNCDFAQVIQCNNYIWYTWTRIYGQEHQKTSTGLLVPDGSLSISEIYHLGLPCTTATKAFSGKNMKISVFKPMNHRRPQHWLNKFIADENIYTKDILSKL